jgi:nitrite reductase/ring-hydroxylating ferredoxin subunit
MIKKPILLALFLLMSIGVLAASACSQVSANSSPVKQSEVKAQINGGSVSVPLIDVENLTNTRFLVKTATGDLSFMAYKYDGKLYIRADICPPCRSESFTLTKGTLVCDSCGTVFNAQTGVGTKGPCLKYPKQLVPFQIQDGNIVMNGADLQSAFQNTLNPQKL